MFTANRIFTFDSNTDCFGIAKSHDVEVKYDLDPNDGSVCIDSIVLSRRIYFDEDGKSIPEGKREHLIIDAAWLSKSTIRDIADEIEQSLLERKVEAQIENYELKKFERGWPIWKAA
ncbi:MAG: hypothetical protein KDJ28_01435 [Candidatus Competibacteraceae bacterium]|nr:hypothetical protein [Candidatus Competibacteraceae bacterium]